MNKKKITLYAVISILLIVGLSVVYFLQTENPLMKVDSTAVNWDGERKKDKEKKQETIAIPGFSELGFIANEKIQEVNFYNPEVNDCYFKLTLLTEESEVMWQSELIEPGKALYSIELSREFAEGTHENVVLKYECFTFDEQQSPLNGSEINLTIHSTQI